MVNSLNWASPASLSPALPPSLAGARLDALNPAALPNILRAGELNTTRLLYQVAIILAGLMQNTNQNPSPAPNTAGSSPAPDTGGSGTSSGTGSSGASSGSGGSSSIGSASGTQLERPGGKIDSSIAANFDSMVAAAKKDGVDLQIESGWRSRQEQEVLYQKYLNGTGNLAAKPGTSNHESGQAIDFKNTPGAFDWLKQNAGKFGFKNLPGEPWHYSVDGK